MFAVAVGGLLMAPTESYQRWYKVPHCTTQHHKYHTTNEKTTAEISEYLINSQQAANTHGAFTMATAWFMGL